MTPSWNRGSMRRYDFSATSSPALAFCHIWYAASTCSLRSPLTALRSCASAAARAASACAFLAITSGMDKRPRVSPARTVCPSDTRISSIRPGTLLEMRTSSASACPSISGSAGRRNRNPASATKAITTSVMANATSMFLLLSDLCSVFILLGMSCYCLFSVSFFGVFAE